VSLGADDKVVPAIRPPRQFVLAQSKRLAQQPLEPVADHRAAGPPADREPEPGMLHGVGQGKHRQRPARLLDASAVHRLVFKVMSQPARARE
jgi:hypothetical protein